MNRKALFLDIDGVLNSNFWNESHTKQISDGTLIDEEKICLLARLVHATNAELVLHSGWRVWFDANMDPIRPEAQKLVHMLSQKGLRISGMTPDLTTEEIRRTKRFSLVKAQEILAWLDEQSDINRWAVLDDLDLHNEYIAQHQIKPDRSIGLTEADILAAEQLLMI